MTIMRPARNSSIASGTLLNGDSGLILSAIVLKGASELETRITTADAGLRASLLAELSHRVITPYVAMAAVLVLLALMIWLSPLPEIDDDRIEADRREGAAARTSIFQFPHLLLGVVCIFVYVGVEVMAGDVIGIYGKALGLSLDVTKNLTAYTLWAMVAGYIIGIVTIPKVIKQEKRVKLGRVAEAERTAQMYARAFECRLRLDEPPDWSN